MRDVPTGFFVPFKGGLILKHRSIAAAVLAAVLTCTLLPAASAAGYTDTAGHWAESYINQATEYGLMEGTGNGLFNVVDNMDRASFVAVLCRMFDWETVTPQSATFIDCAPDYWGYAYVETAAAHGVVDKGGAFRPTDPISREEMSVMLVRALGYQDLADDALDVSLPFEDAAALEEPGYVALAWQFGLTTGVEEADGLYFLPAHSATRPECAAMLVRVYERYISRVNWLHGFYAVSAYSQIGLTDAMDAVSMGWGRLEYADGTVTVNTTNSNDNGWYVPEGASLALSHLEQAGTPCYLCVFGSASDTVTLPDGSTSSTVAAMLSTQEGQDQAIAALTNLARGYDGLTIDFEGLRAALKEDYAAFLARLRAALPASKILNVCVQPGPYLDGYDFKALGEVCNKVILMAHDYRPPQSSIRVGATDTSAFALTPFSYIYDALTEITDPDTGVADRSKIALALSMDTTGFKLDETGAVAEAAYYRPSIATLIQRLAQEDAQVTYVPAVRSSYVRYHDENGDLYQIWFESAESVTDKINLARMFGVTGVSVWRLGNVPNSESYDLWSAILAQR